MRTEKVSARKYILLPKEDVELLVISNVKLRMWLADFITACHNGDEASKAKLVPNARAFFQENAGMHMSIRRGTY